MNRGTVHINELRLRASGLTRDQARRLGEMVAGRLSDLRLTNNQARRIPALSLRVGSVKPGSFETTADEIARAIREQLK